MMEYKFDKVVENITKDVVKAGDKGTITIVASGPGNLTGMGDIEKLLKRVKKKDGLKLDINYKDKNTQIISGDLRDLNWFDMRLRQYMKKNSVPDVKVGKIVRD